MLQSFSTWEVNKSSESISRPSSLALVTSSSSFPLIVSHFFIDLRGETLVSDEPWFEVDFSKLSFSIFIHIPSKIYYGLTKIFL